MNRKSYPTDLNNAEWEFLEPYFIVSYAKGGRPPKYSKRELINAVLYILRTGCQWKCLPHDFPNWKTVDSSLKSGDTGSWIIHNSIT